MAHKMENGQTNLNHNSKTSVSRENKRHSPDRTRRSLMSPVKKLSALRLVSPIDSDQELIDLEVASVLAEGGSVSPNKAKRHETPVRPATVMTNVQRGNIQTATPVFQNVTLHHLAAQGELNMLKLQVEQGADLNKVDEYGLTPLLWACANGQLQTVKYLLEMNVELSIVGHHQENGLLFASCYGYSEIVKLLLQLGMEVNYVDETCSSSLMYAAYNNHSKCVKLLLDYGADMTLNNENGHTAMDLAVGQGHKTVQQAIESHMLKLFEALT
ncbi:Ankyrin repeat A protein 2 [Mactra antiquata]